MTAWQILLAVLLLLLGLLAVTNVRIEHSNVVIGLLELATATFLFLKK